MGPPYDHADPAGRVGGRVCSAAADLARIAAAGLRLAASVISTLCVVFAGLALTLARFSAGDLLVELCRLVPRNAKTVPTGVLQVLGEKHDLSHVIGVVRQLAVNRLGDGMRLSPNGHAASEV